MSSLIDQLRQIVGDKNLLSEATDVLPYSFDGTPVLHQRAACVVFPTSADQVAGILRVAAQEGAPVVTRGSGTGLSAGSVPVAGCVVLCLVQMNRILELDTRNLTIRVEPGVITEKIDEAAAEVGLFYPPDPGSQIISTIGENVAENSGGLRGLKYGVTRDYVMGLEVVLADGPATVVADEALAMEQIAREHQAIDVQTARDQAEATRLVSARRSALSALARVRPTTILEDVTVPRSELAKMVAFVATTAEKYNLQVGTFGHMGDGNLHPTFLTDERDSDQMERVEQALAEIVAKTLDLGGTVTGEHGVGLAKKAFLKQQLGDASYRLLKMVKATFDPEGLLNPGKIFD